MENNPGPLADSGLADLHYKVALVTGASSGLGREFCLSLARRGCRVVAAARRTKLLYSLMEEMRSVQKSNSKAAIVQMDVSVSEAEVDSAVDKAWQAFGRIDVLVNNAGFRGGVKSSLDLDTEEWNKVIATNLRGLWLVSKAVGKRMRTAKIVGSIINITSIASIERGTFIGCAAYAASKAAVIQLTKVMAMELGKYEIRVNAIAPGIFKSEITDGLLEQSWVHKVAQKIVPMQRWEHVDPNLTSVVTLLASDSSSYITGTIFIIDGGYSIPGIPIWSSL